MEVKWNSKKQRTQSKRRQKENTGIKKMDKNKSSNCNILIILPVSGQNIIKGRV